MELEQGCIMSQPWLCLCLLPAMNETQTCMPQEKESTRRCSTLTRSVGSPSVTMVSLYKIHVHILYIIDTLLPMYTAVCVQIITSSTHFSSYDLIRIQHVEKGQTFPKYGKVIMVLLLLIIYIMYVMDVSC